MILIKILAKEIDVISVTDKLGNIKPLRFKLNNNVIKVDKVVDTKETNFAGQNAYVYRCQSWIDDHEKVYELRYDKKTCKWVLYKM